MKGGGVAERRRRSPAWSCLLSRAAEWRASLPADDDRSHFPPSTVVDWSACERQRPCLPLDEQSLPFP